MNSSDTLANAFAEICEILDKLPTEKLPEPLQRIKTLDSICGSISGRSRLGAI